MKEFVEIQNWGINTLIISSLITMIFTIFQGYGFIKQSQKIWKNKSVKSLSTPFFFLFFFYFIAFLFYGLSKNSLSMVFNGFLFITCIPIVVGIIKFKRLSYLEIISLFVTALVVPVMIIIKQKDIFLFILLVISLILLLSQLLTMIKEKSKGSVEIKFIVVFLITAIFWFIYSSLLKNWPLQVFNFLASIVYILILYFYRKYKKEEWTWRMIIFSSFNK